MPNNGWVKVFRKILDNEIWEDKPFGKGQAWIDLLLTANFEDTPFTKRGHLKTTQKHLAFRWGWNIKTVRRFIEGLQKGDQTTIKTDNKYTYITIKNYDVYQTKGITNVHSDGQKRDTTKEIRRKEERKPPIIPLIEESYLEEVSQRYGVPISFVRYQWEALQNYVSSNGKHYKDYKAALRNFVLKDLRNIREKERANDRYTYTYIGDGKGN